MADNFRALRKDVEEITWRYYEGQYGEYRQDIDILLTYIEQINNRLLTAKERNYRLRKRVKS